METPGATRNPDGSIDVLAGGLDEAGTSNDGVQTLRPGEPGYDQWDAYLAARATASLDDEPPPDSGG